MNQTDMTPARLKTSIAGFPSDDAAVTTPNTLREVFSQRKAKQGSRDDAAEKADTMANTVTFSETSSETHKGPEAAVCSALSDSEDVKPKSNACCYYLRKLLYIVTGTLLCAVIHDVARVVCHAAVPEKDIYVRSVDVRFPEQDPGSELRISGNISMSSYLLLTGFEGKSIDCEAFLFSRQRGASPEDDLTTLASMSWNNSQTSYDQQKPGGNHKITHLMSLSAHGNVQLEPLAVHRNINELELNIFNINVEEMQNLMMSDTRKSEHGQRIDSTLPPVEQVHLSCKAVIEFKLFGIVPHPLSVFLDETIQQKMFGGLNSEEFVDMQVEKRKVTALRSFEETSSNWSSVKEKKQSDSSKAVPMSKILSAISITHSTIKGGKHGMLGLTLEVAYDRLVNQSFWSEQWTSSEIRTTGMFARLSTARVHLPRLSVTSRAFNPLDAYQGPESVNITAQSEEVTINVLSVLENETSISPQVNVALVCEYMNRAGDWHNCIRAGFWELRDDLRAVEDKLNLRKLLKAPWQHMNIWARGDDIVDDTRRLPPTSLTWSAVREQMDALYMQGKHPAERGLLDEEIPFLEELRPEEAFSMNITCNNLLCDFGNNMASTTLSLVASENYVVCSLTVGTKLRANGTLVGGENDVGEWISYTKLEMTWDSDTTAALQATARLSEDKQYGSMYILCDAEDWIGLEAFNGSGILNVDEDANYAEMSMRIIEIHKEESGENEEWLHVSSSVDVTSEGDAHSLSAHALVRVDGDEQMSMSTAAGYDDGGADMDMTVAWDQEEYLRSVAHVRSTDAGDDATAVEMAALLRVDDKQVFDMVGNGTWREDEGAAMVLTVEGDDEDEEWLHVSSSVDVTSEGDAHSLSAHALVRVDGDEQMSMSTAAGYDDGGADMDMTVAWDQEEYLRSVAHVRSTDAGDDATAVEMAALLRVDDKQVFDMVGNGTWREDEGAAMVLTVEGDDEDEEWLHVSSSVDVTSEGDAHSLSAHALVRVDGDEQMSMSTAAGYDDGGADMDMTVAWDQEEYLRSVAHVRSTDAGDDATAVEMAALLRVDDKQVFDMVGNGTWREDEGAAMVLTVEGDDEDEEWLHVSSSVDVTSEGDAHSLSAHALVRVDGDEQMSMSTAAGYDDGGADMNMTVAWDQEEYLRSVAHVRSTDAGDDATAVEMAALLRVDDKQVFDMVGNGTWREDEGAAMVLTVEGDDEDEEWLHVSSSVDVTSEGDAHSLSAHALVRVDGDEQMSMSTAAGYDDGGADMDMTVAWDQEEYLRSVAHVRSTDAGDDATAVEMAALLRVDDKQVFDMVGNGTWREDEGAAMVLTVEGDDEDEEWLHVSSSVDVTSEGDAHSLSAHALVRVDGDEQMSMSTAAGYDDGGADMNMTVAWDQEEYLRSAAHVRSTDAGDAATAVEMAALLCVDDKQVFDMVGNGTWREDEGAAMVLTVEGDDEDEEWLHVSSSVDVTSEGDAHSLSAHALVRVDGDEQMSMSTAAGYDDGGADMDMTVAWDQEEYLRSVAHVRSTDAGDDATAVEMAALLRGDDKQVFDMVGNGTWREDEGAAMVLTVEGDDEDEEWLHVSSSVDVTSEGDAHSLSAHALVRVDGDEQMSMSTAAGYDDGGADMNMTVAWDQEEYLRSAAHVRSTDAGDAATAVEMAALLCVDDKQVFDMVGNGTWREDEGAAMVLTVEGDDEDEEWLHVSSSVDVTSEGDFHSLSAHALVRVDGDEQMSMSTAARYDDGGADMNMTVAWDQEEYLRSVAHVRSTDAGDAATAVEMAALLRVDDKQVFGMVGDGTWHEDQGAAMVLTVEGDDEDEEWLHVSSSVDVTSEGDAHSLSAHALVRVDGDEQMSMSTAAGYDDGGADMDMTVAWDQEEYLRSVAHVRSTDVGDDATAVEMAALLRVDAKQVFDMVGDGTWHEDEGAAMVLTVEGDDEDEEWLHVSSSVDVTSEGDAHSLSAHALVRVDGDEQMSMSTAAGYDDGGADMNMTVAWDQEEYLHMFGVLYTHDSIRFYPKCYEPHDRIATSAIDDVDDVGGLMKFRWDAEELLKLNFSVAVGDDWAESSLSLHTDGEERLHGLGCAHATDLSEDGHWHSIKAEARYDDGAEHMSVSEALAIDFREDDFANLRTSLAIFSDVYASINETCTACTAAYARLLGAHAVSPPVASYPISIANMPYHHLSTIK
ncbi:hypothetical protein CYMTET_46441 [Cymbomonas tetramitiformis]|uniref:Uncharacterized protein n=1 Tax=Cymbomonas tetramitiformis TaxID=36881 RepID=A0AAE0BW55_9CHLO|nr:hypothetical protein CYMTET_46441 [Cymbomonas tetramitiformis]